MKINEQGTEAANTAKPIFTASALEIPELWMMTAMTAMIRNARGQGCGMSRDRMAVSAKMPMMMLRNPVTKRSM